MFWPWHWTSWTTYCTIDPGQICQLLLKFEGEGMAGIPSNLFQLRSKANAGPWTAADLRCVGYYPHCIVLESLNKPNKHQKHRETPENPGRNCGCIHYHSVPSSNHLPIMFQSTLLIFHHSNISEKFGIKDCAWQPCSKRCSFFCPRGTVGQSEQLGIDDYQ